MRLSLIASLAALGVSAASDSFDDDDLNFLRLLSSNASSNATMAPTTVAVVNTTVAPANTTVAPATTVAPMNTTVAPMNTTVAPMNTTVAPMNTTVAPVATTVVNGSATTVVSEATTVVSEATTVVQGGDETTVASEATTVVQGGDETTVVSDVETTAAPIVTTLPPSTPVTGDSMCTAATYTMLGLKAPTIEKKTTGDIGMECIGGTFEFKSDATAAYFLGSRAVAQGNLDKCAANNGTATNALVCGTDKTVTWFNKQSTSDTIKKAALGLCCGYPSGFMAQGKLENTMYTAGTFYYGSYSDSACTTPLDATEYEHQQEFGDKQEHQWALGTCIAPSGMYGGTSSGISKMLITSNGTGTTGDGHFIYAHYFDEACANVIESGVGAEYACKVKAPERQRQLGAHPDNSTTAPGSEYQKMLVDGTGAITDLQIVSDTQLTFENLPDFPDDTAKTTFVDTTATTVFEGVKAAAGADATTTLISQYGTGKLALATRRRLSKRRQLGGHLSEVFVVTETTVPVAKADTAKQALDTAKATGDLSVATLGAAVVDAVKADASLSTLVGNLTAPTIVMNVAPPAIPVASPPSASNPGSTSGATSECLGFAAGAVLFASALVL